RALPSAATDHRKKDILQVQRLDELGKSQAGNTEAPRKPGVKHHFCALLRSLYANPFRRCTLSAHPATREYILLFPVAAASSSGSGPHRRSMRRKSFNSADISFR